MAINIDTSLYTACENLREDIINGKLDESKDKIIQIEGQLDDNDLIKEEKFYLLSTLGKYYRKAKNYDKAGHYIRQAIRLSKKIENDHLEMIVDTYLDYANLELDYGQDSNARIELAKLLAVLDTNNYQDSYTYGVIFSHLAQVSIKEENIESGINQYEKALNYYRKTFPDTHPILASTIYKLSDVYIKIEEYHQALHLHHELMDAYKEQKDKHAVAKELLKMGEVYFYIDLKEARKIITNAIKQIATLQEDHPVDMSKAVLMLAEIDENMGNFPRAINYYKKAIAELTKVYEENHFMVVYIYSKIGTISIRTFKLNQAKEYLERGLPLSVPYPKIRMQFLYALGKIYSDEKKYEKAQEVFQEFLERLEKEGRKNSIAYGNTLQAIAFNDIKQDQIDKAFLLYEKALAIYERLPNCKEEKGLTCIRLAYCYENKEEQDKKKAEQYYEKGYKLIEKTRNQDLLEETLTGIIEFYNRNDKQKKSIYEDKLVKLINSKKS